jgi:hypothetical protein
VPPPNAGNFEPIPGSFLSQYPAGTQQRWVGDIQETFNQVAPKVLEIWREEQHAEPCSCGKVIFAIAVDPEGTVVGTAVIFKNLNSDSVINKIQSVIGSLSFGRAKSGAGLYVFKYPVNLGRLNDDHASS